MSGRRIPLEGSAKLLALVSVLELSLSLSWHANKRSASERWEKSSKTNKRALLARAPPLADPREHTGSKIKIFVVVHTFVIPDGEAHSYKMRDR